MALENATVKHAMNKLCKGSQAILLENWFTKNVVERYFVCQLF